MTMTMTIGNRVQHNTERFSDEEIERISEHINDFLEPQGDCLIWRGMTPNGAPLLTTRRIGRRVSVQPQAFLAMKADPTLVIGKHSKTLALCGNSLCCNTEHLQFNSKLNTYQVKEIVGILNDYIKLKAQGHKNTNIAKQLGISYRTLLARILCYEQDKEFWESSGVHSEGV